MSSLPTLERLNEVFTHSIVEGRLYWKNRKHRSTLYAGQNQKSRKRVRVDGKDYFAYRIIWKMVTGTDPEDLQIDHKDRNHTNDAFHNLRLADSVTNNRNKVLTNLKHLRGIQWKPRLQKWQATIYLEGKGVYLGVRTSEEEAHQLYVEAHKKYFGEYGVY